MIFLERRKRQPKAPITRLDAARSNVVPEGSALVRPRQSIHSMQIAQSTVRGGFCVDDFLDLKSLAIRLNKTPDQVRRLAERGQLPGRRVGGEWRFEKAEIFHWLEAHLGSADSADLQQLETMLQPDHAPTMSLADLCTPELVWLGLPSRTRGSLVRDICTRAADAGRVWDPVALAAAIEARENMHSTALDNGIALLHSRRPMPNLYDSPFLALAVTPSGIPFGGPRGVLTDVFFLIASGDETFHLHLLARLSRLISLPGAIDGLRNSESPKAAIEWIRECEQQLD